MTTPVGPRFVFLETTSTCNLRCQHCHLWRTQEPPDALETAEKVALVGQLAEWVDHACVVLTGGETMLKREEFFAITSACRAAGLSSAANTNGTLVDDETVDRLLSEGPRYLVLSLDSHRREVFDRTRGKTGTFDTVVGLIRKLVERRQRHPGTDVRIMTSTILYDENLAELPELVRLCQDLGVDSLLFQPLSQTFGLSVKRDAFFERHFPRDLQAVDQAVDALIDLRRQGVPIETSESDLNWVKLYARDPNFIGEQVCGSAERNMMVDQMGRVQLCFRMHDLTGGRFLGNVRDNTLRALWESEFAGEARGIMGKCRQNCGMLNCHRRLEAA